MNRTKELKKIKSLSILEFLSCFFLYLYISLNYLSYIEFIPVIYNTLSLYSFVGISMLYWIVEKRHIHINHHIKWFFAITLLTALGSLYSPDLNISFGTIITMIKVFIFALMISVVVDSKKKIERVFHTIIYSASFLLIYLIFTDKLLQDERLGMTLTGNANIFASLYLVASFIAIYFVYKHSNIMKKTFYLIFFLLFEYSLMLSGGRKYFIIPILAFVLIYIFEGEKKNKLYNKFVRVIIAVSLLCALYWAVFNVPLIYGTIGYRFEGFRNYFTNAGNADASTIIRMQMIEKAFSLWLASPLWGQGTDSFSIITNWGVYSHNNFLELLCNLGLIGFITYYSYIVWLLIKYIKIKDMSFRKWYWLVIIICLLAFDFGAVTYYMFFINMLYQFAYINYSTHYIDSKNKI